MANVLATHSVGNSLMTYLKNAYPEPLRTDHPFEFKVISCGELAEAQEPRNTVSLFLFRITQDEYLRGRKIPSDPPHANPPLSIDLHYLLTAWADSVVPKSVPLTMPRYPLLGLPEFGTVAARDH